MGMFTNNLISKFADSYYRTARINLNKLANHPTPAQYGAMLKQTKKKRKVRVKGK